MATSTTSHLHNERSHKLMSFDEILRIPGPTPIPPAIHNAMNRPIIGHRTNECEQLISTMQPMLKSLFGTSEDVFILTNSGTGSMEATVASLTNPGDEVVVGVTGGFGERFLNICKAYQLKTHAIHTEWKDPLTPGILKKHLKGKENIRAVFLTYSETSTGILNPIPKLAKVIKEETDALIIVDGVSAIGGAPMKMDDWGIDACVTSSQKALMLPPGLSLIALNAKAKKKMNSAKHTRFYLDLNRYEEKMLTSSTPFTPAVSLLFGLYESLQILHEETLSEVYRRHNLMRDMTRNAFKTLDFHLLTDDEFASPTVTAVQTNEDVAFIRKTVHEDFGLVVAGAPKHLKSSVFRVGHMGYCYPQDVLQYISIFETTFRKLGIITDDQLGKATRAAQQTLLQSDFKENNR